MTETPLKQDFIDSLADIPGLDASALATALSRIEPVVAIRRNAAKTAQHSRMFADSQSVPWNRFGEYLTARPRFTLDARLHAGVYYVQDASSMVHGQIVERIAAIINDAGNTTPHNEIANQPLTLLDFCAAPGGKTTAMADALPQGSTVVANEVVPQRGAVLRENLEKWGFPGVIATGSDAKTFADVGPIFDIVAVDAPCSGEGMMRKDMDARQQWSPGLIEKCAQLQREILESIAQTVKPGGYLIYSTCTFNCQENEENARFIADSLGFEPIDPIKDLQLEGIDTVARGTPEFPLALRFMPHFTRGEGLFCAVFRRPTESAGCARPQKTHLPNIPVSKQRNGGKKSNKGNKQADYGELGRWFTVPMNFSENGGTVSALPLTSKSIADALERAGIRITACGLPCATLKHSPRGNLYLPDARMVLSTAFNREAFPTVELTEQEALDYLCRESLTLPPDVPKGYVAVAYDGHPLGMVKNLGNRTNNLHPASWRILHR